MRNKNLKKNKSKTSINNLKNLLKKHFVIHKRISLIHKKRIAKINKIYFVKDIKDIKNN